MSVTNNRHSASGSFSGYLFQIERLLFWLSISDVEIVALETDDDIVAKYKGAPTTKVLEQAKHSVTRKIPYSDNSIDLWKTLSIWVEGIISGGLDVEKTTFSIITNKKLPSSRLIRQIVDGKNDPIRLDSCINKMLSIASAARTSIRPFAEIVLKCDRTVLKHILSRVDIISEDTAIDMKSLKRHVRSNLAISEKLPFDYIFNDILGFVVHHIIQTWKKNEQMEIKRELLLRRVNELIAAYHKKTFIERTIDLLPLSHDEIERNKGKLFVEQLRAINCDEDDIIKAINDFLRASIEKLRYAEEGEVLEYQFEMYYLDLKEHWQSIYKPKCRIRNGLMPEDVGYDIFHSTVQYRGKLNNQEPEQSYTYKGAYHHLANIPEIGWYPDWEKKFKKTS